LNYKRYTSLLITYYPFSFISLLTTPLFILALSFTWLPYYSYYFNNLFFFLFFLFLSYPFTLTLTIKLNLFTLLSLTLILIFTFLYLLLLYSPPFFTYYFINKPLFLSLKLLFTLYSEKHIIIFFYLFFYFFLLLKFVLFILFTFNLPYTFYKYYQI
jgi:hypothetical protein